MRPADAAPGLALVTHSGYIRVKMIALRPDAIRVWRKERGLTQAELAKRANISRATVSRIEQGDTESVTFDTVNRIAAALEQDADALVTFERSESSRATTERPNPQAVDRLRRALKGEFTPIRRRKGR